MSLNLPHQDCIWIDILHIHESNNGKWFAYIIHVQEYKAVKKRELFGAKKGRF